jgi:hypothetical protein
MLRVAFETLLESSHLTLDLQRKFADCLAGTLTTPKWYAGCNDEAKWRGRWSNNVSRPFDAWVQDFCNVRNDSAHGLTSRSKYPPSIWDQHRHLLFGSWLFPLLVKLILSKTGAYTLSDLDKDLLADCERFFSTDVLAVDSDGRLQWNIVDCKLRERQLGRALYGLSKQ